MYAAWIITAAVLGYTCLSSKTRKRIGTETKKALEDMRKNALKKRRPAKDKKAARA